MSEETGEPASPETGNAPVPIWLVASDRLDELITELPDAQSAWVRANSFRARLGTALALPGADGSIERVLVGWGTEATRRHERLHLGSFARTAPAGSYRLDGDLDGGAGLDAGPLPLRPLQIGRPRQIGQCGRRSGSGDPGWCRRRPVGAHRRGCLRYPRPDQHPCQRHGPGGAGTCGTADRRAPRGRGRGHHRGGADRGQPAADPRGRPGQRRRA